jgi:glutamyl-tRNA(Gln) amidotransferase subunit D
MYSKKVLDALKLNSISIGDTIKIDCNINRGEYSGILLPRQMGGDADCLVIKLDSGYNVGIRYDSDCVLSKLKAAEKKDEKKISVGGEMMEGDYISVISTGGTIASKVDYKTGGVHPAIDADDLLHSYPSLQRFKPFRTRRLLSLLSEDLKPEHWSEMARAVKEEFEQGAKGIVIAHGTDTMGYSAAALSYALENLPGPVVFTGAQRSPDRASSDAAQNIFCSMAAARADFADVVVCMHASSSDDINHIHIGTRVRKAHTSGRWAFKSIGAKPLGSVDAKTGEIKFNAQPQCCDGKKKIDLWDKFSDNVAILWVYPGMKASEFSKLSDYDGVVIAGTGLGHVPVDSENNLEDNPIRKEIIQLVKSDVLVAMAAQTGEGRIKLDTYSTGRILKKAGVLGNDCDWLLETAYVKMCWALGQTNDKKKAAKLLTTPMHQDITDFSVVDEKEL